MVEKILTRFKTTLRKGYSKIEQINYPNPALKRQVKDGQFHLTTRQCNKLISKSDTMRDALVMRILIETGIRREEVSKLETLNFFQKKKSLVVIGKGNKERIIPVTNELNQSLKFYLADSKQGKKGYLFPSRQSNCKNSPIRVETVNEIVKRAGVNADIKNPNPRLKHLNPHLLRHTFAHKWKHLGMSWDKLAMVMGHESVSTTINIYGLPNYEEVEKFMKEKNPL